jgi:hypothetical protein
MSPINLIPRLYPNLDKYMPDYRIFFSFELIQHKDMNVCSGTSQKTCLFIRSHLKIQKNENFFGPILNFVLFRC